MSNTPDYIKTKLRQRMGLEKNDSSNDDDIEKMTADEKFSEVIGWELGYSTWAAQLLEWAKDCGLEIIGDKSVLDD
jgi:hypothetical protein